MADLAQLKALAHGLTVLLVDDDPAMRELLQLRLGALFGTVWVAGSGDEALACYRAQPPGEVDLVVTDIEMPGMDGLQLANALRQHDREQKIVVISAHDEAATFLRALEIGVDGFIVKPVQTPQLHDTLSKLCRAIRDRKVSYQYQGYLEDERRIVASLMHGLMDQEGLNDPAVEWVLRPCQMVGGDMIAVYRNAGGSLYAMLADSTGHGLPSAINLLPLHRIFYAMASKGFALPTLVDEMNRVVCDQSTADRFVATTLLHFDPRDRMLELWNGGNPPALLYDRHGRVECTLRSESLPLGIVRDGPPVAVRRHFCSEQSQLLLYSDGVLDAEDSRETRFGHERLADALAAMVSAGQPLEAVMQRVEAHLEGRAASDDISLLRLFC